MTTKRAKAPLPAAAKQYKTVSLAPVLDLKAAAPLAEELLTFRGADLQIDASAVQRIGAQCLQILVAARRTWHDEQCQVLIVDPSDAFRSSAGLLDTARLLFEPVEFRS